MKCIQAVKQTKEHSVGEILRVDDKTAFNMVGSYWKYVSKSEWRSKKSNNIQKTVDNIEVNSEPVEEKTNNKKKTKNERRK